MTAKEQMEALRDIERELEWERNYSQKYLNDFVTGIKNIKREAIIEATRQSVPHKIPFKMKLRNFFNKILKIM